MSVSTLERYLVGRGIATQEQWNWAVQQTVPAEPSSILSLLEEHSVLQPEQTHAAFASSNGWEYRNVPTIPIRPDLVDLIDPSFARKHNIIPLDITDREITVATDNPDDGDLKKALRGSIGKSINLVYSPREQLAKAVRLNYSTAAESQKLAQNADRQTAENTDVAQLDPAELSEVAKLFNLTLETAVEARASDITIEEWEHEVVVRHTIDNVTTEATRLGSALGSLLINFIKNNANMPGGNLTPKKGRLNHINEQTGLILELRVAALPTVWGVSLTMRIATRTVRDLADVGFRPETLRRWKRALDNPNGMVIATGPMASGKTQTIMSTLDYLKPSGRKIMTMDIPTEIRVSEGITQVEIDTSNVTWGQTMPVVLSSRASVLSVGEINEDEIAQETVQASLTGHLVLSTLHTNSAPASIIRLREMGLRPSVLAETLRAVLAQRLPRRLCVCKVPVEPTPEQVSDFQLTPQDLADTTWFGPRGCEVCGNLGYRGQVAIHELMTFNDDIRRLILADSPTFEIAEAARRAGMTTLLEDGLGRVREGDTSLEELRRHLLID